MADLGARLSQLNISDQPVGPSPAQFCSLDEFLSQNNGLPIRAVLADLETLGSNADALENAVERLVKAADGGLIVLLSEKAPVSLTLAALYAGAHEVLSRGIGASDLARRVEELAFRHAPSAPERDMPSRSERGGTPGWVGISQASAQICSRIARMAGSTAPVFITGAAGAGKTLAANLVHAQSARGEGPLIILNARGAHNVEIGRDGEAVSEALCAADGGTLLLDNVDALTAAAQAQLLRYLQTGRTLDPQSQAERGLDVRLIATSGPDGLAAQQGVREDLFYRLTVLPLSIPALSERTMDIVPLARHFLTRAGAAGRGTFVRFSARAEQLLVRLEYARNARDLEALISRLAETETGDVATERMVLASMHWLRHAGLKPAPSGTANGDLQSASSASTAVEPLPEIAPMWVEEQRVIERALKLCGGNIAQAAAALEISPSTIYRKKQFWAQHGHDEHAA